MIVVDTSVLVAFFRGDKTTQVERLQQMEQQDTPFLLPAICCQEVLQGAKDGREWALLRGYLETQRILFAKRPWDSHVEAARIFFDCRRKGITIGSSIDCLIAQMVLEVEGVLLHDDDDFERVKEIRPLQTLAE